MEDKYGDYFVTITDDEGIEYELEVLSSLEYEGETYLALVPADADDDAETEVAILKQVHEDGEDVLVTVDDENVLEKVYDLFMEQIYAEDEETEEN